MIFQKGRRSSPQKICEYQSRLQVSQEHSNVARMSLEYNCAVLFLGQICWVFIYI